MPCVNIGHGQQLYKMLIFLVVALSVLGSVAVEETGSYCSCIWPGAKQDEHKDLIETSPQGRDYLIPHSTSLAEENWGTGGWLHSGESLSSWVLITT